MKTKYKNILSLVFIMTLSVYASAQNQSATELGEQGIRAYEIGDLVLGMTLMQQAAEQGYVPAQAKLGYIFDKSEDNELSVQWYQRAAEAGDAAGQLGLSGMYARGEGIEQSDAESLQLLQAAVEQRHLPALSVYAAALENGDLGLEQSLQDFERGIKLTRACQNALNEAQQKVQILLEKNNQTSLEDFDQNNWCLPL